MTKEKIKVYFDTSVYNRPFDDQKQIRIRLETEAFLSIFEKAVSGAIIVIASSALYYENSQNPFIERRERVTDYLMVASRVIKLNSSIKNKALVLEDIGIDPMDALHIAYAEFCEADYFLTCDDGIIKQYRKHVDVIKTKVYNPLEFILKEVFQNA